MGEVRTEVTLVNIGDKEVADRGYMPQDQVRRLTVNAVVDTGAWTLVINEETREKLGLRVKRTTATSIAGGGTVAGGVTEPVMVCWKDRETPCQAVVLPNEDEVLLGALPLEGMDLTVNPLRNEVTGAHGDTIRIVVK
ncbi:MAG: retroviral-like aspartic protease family protein [Treponema sp.]|jgi:clan AA aspartic protease|nr:retroviral-like aspartic protease family protein [Treponema sp.]